MDTYKRFWFEFDAQSFLDLPPGTGIGCGVTASDYDDAIGILNKCVFKGAEMPAIKRVITDVRVSDLDEGHVLPNMNRPDTRGVWYPIGYS
jgi:hypothetical protein